MEHDVKNQTAESALDRIFKWFFAGWMYEQPGPLDPPAGVTSIEYIRADLAPQPTGWQPIETAPKDGIALIGYRENKSIPGYDEFSIIKWYDGTWQVRPSKDGRLSHMATHWMPLPLPPKEAE